MASKKITKYDLIEAVFQNTKSEKSDVQEILEAFFDQVKKSLGRGDVIELRGFGTFESRLRNGRKEARNPKTGEKVSVLPHYTVVFRAGQELKKMVSELPVFPSFDSKD